MRTKELQLLAKFFDVARTEGDDIALNWARTLDLPDLTEQLRNLLEFAQRAQQRVDSGVAMTSDRPVAEMVQSLTAAIQAVDPAISVRSHRVTDDGILCAEIARGERTGWVCIRATGDQADVEAGALHAVHHFARPAIPVRGPDATGVIHMVDREAGIFALCAHDDEFTSRHHPHHAISVPTDAKYLLLHDHVIIRDGVLTWE